jgi:perosamine synthetase
MPPRTLRRELYFPWETSARVRSGIVISHNRPTLGNAEKEAALRVLDSGWIAQGREVEAFESEVCKYVGLDERCAVALSSGTAALFMALWVLGAKGKRVAIPVYSCAALRNAVVMAGAEPVAIDVAADSPNIDLNGLPSTGVDLIVAAHMFGFPSRWPRVFNSIPVIEDCAQAFGARIDGIPVGGNGTAAVFSFYATKMLTSGGQGGMLVSRERSIIDAVRDYRQFDSRQDRVPRFNLQMTDLQAAVGRAQLAQIGEFITRRREIQNQYVAAGIPLWRNDPAEGLEPNYYRAIVEIQDTRAAIEQLERDGVCAIVPIHDWELLDDAERFPRASALCRRTISLPTYPLLKSAEVLKVIQAASKSVSTGKSRQL